MFSKKTVGEITTITYMNNYKFRINDGVIVYVKGLTSTSRSSKNFAENLHNYLLILAADNADGFISFLDSVDIQKDEITKKVLEEMYEKHSAVSVRLSGIPISVWNKISELLHKK